MRLSFIFLMLLCSINFNLRCQQPFDIKLNIGDSVPALKIKKWIKGTPITTFEKDKIYVVDFWASWCYPCMASMPHLSKFAKRYRDKATVLSIDILEEKKTPESKIKKLVDSLGDKMDFSVGMEESNFMAKNWVDTSEQRSIPTVFIINNQKIDWIGHPLDLDSVFTRILNNTWNTRLARLKRSNQLYLSYLDFDASRVLVDSIFQYRINMAGNTYDRVIIGPDSVIVQIDKMVKEIPDLTFLPSFLSFKFSALLKTDPKKAYDFAREAMVKPRTGDYPEYTILIRIIDDNTEKLKLPEYIYRLGAEFCQALINKDRYPELGNSVSNYQKMAEMYTLAGDSQKAAEALEHSKTITNLTSEPDN